MEILYPAFTAVMFLVSVLCGVHAWTNRKRVFYISAIVYGLLLEKLVILYFENYTYPASEMLDAFGIPLAIGFGWSAVIYSGYVTARTFGFSRRHLPVFAGLYAVHLDLAMDTIAIRVPFWEWTANGDWFGVPLGNFLGWFLVALFFTFVYQYVSEQTTNPFLVGGGSILGAVLLLIPTLEVWTEITADSVFREASILSVLLVISIVHLRTAEIRARPVSALVSVSVFLFHGFFLVVLVVLGLYKLQPILLLLSLSMIAIGIAIHLWPLADVSWPHRSVKSSPNDHQ